MCISTQIRVLMCVVCSPTLLDPFGLLALRVLCWPRVFKVASVHRSRWPRRRWVVGVGAGTTWNDRRCLGMTWDALGCGADRSWNVLGRARDPQWERRWERLQRGNAKPWGVGGCLIHFHTKHAKSDMTCHLTCELWESLVGIFGPGSGCCNLWEAWSCKSREVATWSYIIPELLSAMWCEGLFRVFWVWGCWLCFMEFAWVCRVKQNRAEKKSRKADAATENLLDLFKIVYFVYGLHILHGLWRVISKLCPVTCSRIPCSEQPFFQSLTVPVTADETFELACAKAVQKLGMKPVPGIMRVTVKKSRLEARQSMHEQVMNMWRFPKMAVSPNHPF